MADRETIIETGGGDSGAGMVAAIVVIVALVLGVLWMTGAINFNRAPSAPVTIEVPAPAPNVTITTPQN